MVYGTAGGEEAGPPSHVQATPLDEVLANIGVGPFHTRLLWVCGLGFAVSAIEVVLLGFILNELRDFWHLNEYQLGALPTAVTIGATCGQLVWGPIADHYGRRLVFMSTVLVVVVAGVASAFAPNFIMFVLMRSVVGFGYGGNICVDLALFAEFLPTRNRGEWLFAMQIFWPVGQLTAALLAACVIPRYGWQVFVVACSVPPLLAAFLRPFTPESPRWLLVQGRPEAAADVCREIAIFNGKSCDEVGLPEGAVVSSESSAFSGVPRAPPETSAWSLQESLSILRLDRSMARTSAGLLIYGLVCNTLSYGMQTLMPTLLSLKGLPRNDTFTSMVFQASAQFPGVILAGVCGTYMGRLLPLKCCLLLTAIPLALFGTMTDPRVSVVFSCLGSMFLEGSWALFHTYLTEVYPTEHRAHAIGAIEAVPAIVSMFIPTIFAHILESHDTVTYAIMCFSAMAFAGCVCTSFLLDVETRGRDLTDTLVKAHA